MSALETSIYGSFQSTLSARRATKSTARISSRKVFQSTLSARRATGFISVDCFTFRISIHALREESDQYGIETQYLRFISIHALREESDAI